MPDELRQRFDLAIPIPEAVSANAWLLQRWLARIESLLVGGRAELIDEGAVWTEGVPKIVTPRPRTTTGEDTAGDGDERGVGL